MNKFIKYIKQYKINSIFVKNFIASFCVVLLPIFVINILIFNYYISNTLNKSTTFANNELNFIQENVDSIFEWIDTNCTHMVNDIYISSFLLNGINNKNITENVLVANVVQNQLQRIKFSDSYIDSVHLYSINADYIISTGGSGNPVNFYDSSLKNDIDITNNEINLTINSNGRHLIRTQAVINIYGIDAGIIFVDIDYEMLKNHITESISNTNHIQICKQNNEILLELGTANNGKYSISRISDDTGLIYSSTYQNTINTTPLIILILLISLIFVFLAAIFLTYKACSPISNIIDIMDDADKWGIRERKLSLAGEAKYILENFLDKVYYSKDIETSLKARVADLKKSQIEAINFQIQPHFLYNTLQLLSMCAMNLTNSENEAVLGIEMLSEILQYSLNSKNYLETVENEINFTKAYVNIQKLKYKNRVKVEFQIDSKVLENKTAKIIIQPLIENSFTHGILPHKETGVIIIKIHSKNNHLLIEVIDNGIGINAEKYKMLQKDLRNDGSEDGKHIGLSNVDKKIKLMFGDEYGLNIDADYTDGSRIIIDQPLE